MEAAQPSLRSQDRLKVDDPDPESIYFQGKTKDVMGGLAQWESKILVLERDYKDCPSAEDETSLAHAHPAGSHEGSGHGAPGPAGYVPESA